MATFNNPGVIIMLFAFLLMKELDSCNSQMMGYSNVSCIESERKALTEFRQSLVDKSHRLSSWVGANCCKWHGVGCSKITGHIVKLNLHNPVMCDDFNCVNYSQACLGGQINPSLLNLKHLRYLDLSMNDFLGIRIPKFLGSFKHLKYLNLSSSNFGGEAPHHLGNLTRLQYLDLNVVLVSTSGWRLYRNSTEEALASKNLWWVSMLSSLKHLDLTGVNLEQASDWLNAINMVPSLLVLKLAECRLRTIPHLSYVNFTSLVTLDLSYNGITTTMPPWFSNITDLLHLNLGTNFINGPLPGSIIGRLTTLTILDLSHNTFLKGSIPTEMGNLTRLTKLDLSSDMLDGYIPIQLGELKNLEYLILSQNSLIGPMPASLGKLSFLRELDISYNKLNGCIPSSIGQLANLETLRVEVNSLSGTVSEHHFAELKLLTALYLSSNSLVFNFNFKWVPPFQLHRIYLGSCTLGPQFPSWLQTQRHVKELSIFNTSIADTIPFWFQNVFSRIPFLDISYNQIGGELPEFQNSGDKSFYSFRYLYLNSNKFEGSMTSVPADVMVLDISNNFLSGNLPLIDESLMSLQALILSNNSLSGSASMLCKIKTLKFIDLSTNQFSGGLPLCLGELQDLIVLDLKNNSFSGHIPSSLSSLQNLEFLHLHSNKFEGKFPLSLRNLTNLITLDLGENALSGTIPEWIVERLPNLRFLSLQSNSFHGEIPLQLCHHPALQLLNLAQNNITGRIPQCFGNFSSMAMVQEGFVFSMLFWTESHDHDREYNDRVLDSLKGRELEYHITAFPFLVSIDLSKNNIVGEIPDEITDLVALRNFNVAGNMLKGRIPKMIGNLKQLESLDLSSNKISGAIPASLSDLNFLSHLNLSFNCLSGKIPTGNQLQTLDDPSIYMGNKELCGGPLLNDCPGDNDSSSSHERLDEGNRDEDASDRLWFYAGVGPGFLVGFLGVCGILHFNKSLRYALFQLIENMYDWIVVAIAVKLALVRWKSHRAKLGR